MNDLQVIQSKIYEIRGQRVMLDRDLAELYQVTTGNLNKAVKRNIRRFPPDFMFQLTKEEFQKLKNDLIFQNGISSWGGTRKLPYAFTEQGLAMLSGILNSEIAIDVNISIMRAFVAIRRMAAALPNAAAEVAQLRKDFEDLKLDIEDILHDQNEINGMALCLAMLATTEGLSSQRSEGSLRPYLHSCSARCYQHCSC